MNELKIPAELLPEDGRFGGGPSKIRKSALAKLAVSPVMGTSHRQPPVKQLVHKIKTGLTQLYRIPDGYEVVLGIGGASLFWDAAVCSLISNKAAAGVYGAFSRKFYSAIARAPFLADPLQAEAPDGQLALPSSLDLSEVDTVCWAQNETSTGVMAPVSRPDSSALVVVDATSAAGGIDVDISQTDAYYFSPQKNFSSDGGLWVAIMSEKAIERIRQVTSSNRWIPDMLNLQKAVDNSRKDQTLNTPSLATLALLDYQLDWVLENGGMEFAAQRVNKSTGHIYRWAQSCGYAHPFVADKNLRSCVVATIELDQRIDSRKLLAALRENGIVDISPYRGTGTNQIRISAYTSVDPEDIEALTNCIDWLVERL